MSEKIRESDEKALVLFDAMPIGCNLWDKNNNIIESNSAILKLYGVEDKDEYARIFFSSLMPKFQPGGEPSAEHGARIIQQAFKEGYKRLEWMYQTKDGEPLPLDTILVRVKYKGEDALAAYVRDLREEKKMQADLQKTVEEKDALINLRNILNNLDTMIYVTDPETDEIIFINETMRLHYNIDEDYEGKYCYKLLQKDKEYRCDNCPCIQLENDPNNPVVWEEYSSLTERFYRNTDSFITLVNGKRVHIQHSVDITELKEMTAAMSQDYKRQILMTDLSRSFLSDENIDTLINNALQKVGEFMRVDQVLLLKAEDNVSKLVCTNEWHSCQFSTVSFINTVVNLPDGMKDKYLSMKEHGKIYFTSDTSKEDNTIYRKDFPNFLCVLIFFNNILYGILDFSRANDRKWSENNINVALLFTNIITGALQKYHVEEQLIYAKELAERNSQYKSSFLANMSHEIRTPMNAILGIAEIKLQTESLPQDTEEAFSKIYESGNLLLNIINDILDLSKIEAGKLEIVPVKYDIPSLINDTVQLTRLRYDSKPIEFILDVDKNIPLNLLGDELRIKQVLNNVLSNAFKYTEYGEVKMTVFTEPLAELKAEQTGNNNVVIVFRVSDTGQGMTPEQLKLLFSEYTRFNLKVNRTKVGTGLGMSITKHLLTLMNGDISVESEVGKGSVFTIRIPQQQIDDNVCGPELVEQLSKFCFKSGSIVERSRVLREYMPYGSVLVVDDVESNLYVAKGMLLPYGLKIEMVESGLEAIEKIKNGNVYDIIFMDHMMPKMDGIETTIILRNMDYTGNIVALTANALVGQEEMFFKNGFDGFISKPIDSRELNSVLNELIRNKKPKEVVEAARKERREKQIKITDKENNSNKEKYFILDAERAVNVLENICENHNDFDTEETIKEYIIAVHGIKSALTIIGENELSSFAYKLEMAAKDKNIALITNETHVLINALKSLIEKFKQNLEKTKTEDGDTEYLREKLTEIKTACEAVNKKAAKKALNELTKKQWSQQISEVLDNISLHLLHSEFEKADDYCNSALDLL